MRSLLELVKRRDEFRSTIKVYCAKVGNVKFR